MSTIGLFTKNAFKKTFRVTTTGIHYWLISGKDLLFLYIGGRILHNNRFVKLHDLADATPETREYIDAYLGKDSAYFDLIKIVPGPLNSETAFKSPGVAYENGKNILLLHNYSIDNLLFNHPYTLEELIMFKKHFERLTNPIEVKRSQELIKTIDTCLKLRCSLYQHELIHAKKYHCVQLKMLTLSLAIIPLMLYSLSPTIRTMAMKNNFSKLGYGGAYYVCNQHTQAYFTRKREREADAGIMKDKKEALIPLKLSDDTSWMQKAFMPMYYWRYDSIAERIALIKSNN